MHRFFDTCSAISYCAQQIAIINRHTSKSHRFLQTFMLQLRWQFKPRNPATRKARILDDLATLPKKSRNIANTPQIVAGRRYICESQPPYLAVSNAYRGIRHQPL